MDSRRNLHDVAVDYYLCDAVNGLADSDYNFVGKEISYEQGEFDLLLMDLQDPLYVLVREVELAPINQEVDVSVSRNVKKFVRQSFEGWEGVHVEFSSKRKPRDSLTEASRVNDGEVYYLDEADPGTFREVAERLSLSKTRLENYEEIDVSTCQKDI